MSSAPFLSASSKTKRSRRSSEFKDLLSLEGSVKKIGKVEVNQGMRKWKRKTRSNSPSIDIPLDSCPECGTHLNEPVNGAEQTHHYGYSISKAHRLKSIIRGIGVQPRRNDWRVAIPPNQQFGPAVALGLLIIEC